MNFHISLVQCRLVCGESGGTVAFAGVYACALMVGGGLGCVRALVCSHTFHENVSLSQVLDIKHRGLRGSVPDIGFRVQTLKPISSSYK